MEAIKGGEFLIKETEAKNIFIPEEWDEEQKMIAQTCQDFLEKEIFPNLDRIDSMEEGLMPSLLEKAGELGMLGISVPEAYGGFGKDFVTGMLVTEAIGAGHSFAVAFSAHSGIGTLPILYYGNEEQKQKYIPKLATGEWKASYCLTEPGSGSADVYTVFAKIDDDENLSAFIVERGYAGLTRGAEEKKMGIKGSSTVQIFLNDCKVPVENLLSERGKGFKIALNILNIGRVKLAGACLGGVKVGISTTINYSNERSQFGRVISKYGAIRHKLAEQAIQTFVLESATYRCSMDIDNSIKSFEEGGMDHGLAILKGVEQFATEAAILKVLGSEVADYVVDEGVQVYGGMGFSAEAPMDRAYRDTRINRIFEGTNEINRMLIVDMLLKKAMKGQLDLMGPAMKVADELMSIPDFSEPGDALFEKEKKYIGNFKKAILMVAGSAAQKLMMTLSKEQEILMNVADMAIWTYAAESVLLRVEKMSSLKDISEIQEQIAIAQTYIYDVSDKINKAGKDALNAFGEGDELRMMLMGMKRFTKVDSFNSKNARQTIAIKMIAENKYCY